MTSGRSSSDRSTGATVVVGFAVCPQGDHGHEKHLERDAAAERIGEPVADAERPVRHEASDRGDQEVEAVEGLEEEHDRRPHDGERPLAKSVTRVVLEPGQEVEPGDQHDGEHADAFWGGVDDPVGDCGLEGLELVDQQIRGAEIILDSDLPDAVVDQVDAGDDENAAGDRAH